MGEPPPKKQKQAKLLSFFTKSNKSGSDHGNGKPHQVADEQSSAHANDDVNPNSKPKTSETTSSGSGSTEKPLKFLDKWLDKYSWLKYDKTKELMMCKLCIKYGRDNHFVTGKLFIGLLN